MGDGQRPAIERFLVEDVILTLGNLRAAFSWLADPGAGSPPEATRRGWERIGRQIDLLERRARAPCGDLRERRPTAAGPAAAAYVEASGIGLEDILRDALGAEGAALSAPVFRTRRPVDDGFLDALSP